MPISSEEFRDALACFASGVTIVTTRDRDGRLYGLTVAAFCSVSLEPPLILVCIDNETRCNPIFKETGMFVVNILNEDQEEISEQFAAQIHDRFTGVSYLTNSSGFPVIEGALVVLECRLRDAYDGGDHTIFVGEVVSAKIREGKPLVYCKGDYRKIRL